MKIELPCEIFSLLRLRKTDRAQVVSNGMSSFIVIDIYDIKKD